MFRETPESLGILAPYVYLKHECANYDQLRDLMRGRRFASFTHPALILQAHPQHLTRVKGLLTEPQFGCRRCGSTARGVRNGRIVQTFCSHRCSLKRDQGS